MIKNLSLLVVILLTLRLTQATTTVDFGAELSFKQESKTRIFKIIETATPDKKDALMVTTENKKTQKKEITKEKSAQIKSAWQKISWDAKNNASQSKTKCTPYAVISLDGEKVTVCQEDSANKNKVFTLMNQYDEYFKF